jgi:hypothetical protein
MHTNEHEITEQQHHTSTRLTDTEKKDSRERSREVKRGQEREVKREREMMMMTM